MTTPSFAVPEGSAAGLKLSFPKEESRKKSATLPKPPPKNCVAIDAASTFGVEATSLNSPNTTSIGRSLSPPVGLEIPGVRRAGVGEVERRRRVRRRGGAASARISAVTAAPPRARILLHWVPPLWDVCAWCTRSPWAGRRRTGLERVKSRACSGSRRDIPDDQVRHGGELRTRRFNRGIAASLVEAEKRRFQDSSLWRCSPLSGLIACGLGGRCDRRRACRRPRS